MHSWESCNAVDINIPIGATVLAVADGTIGSQIGALDSTAAVLEGLRLHLTSDDNEWYYAPMSAISVAPGQRVSKGDHLGKSGSAAGVAHLHLAQKHGDPGALIGQRDGEPPGAGRGGDRERLADAPDSAAALGQRDRRHAGCGAARLTICRSSVRRALHCPPAALIEVRTRAWRAATGAGGLVVPADVAAFNQLPQN